jgi:hypothetical protein
MTVPAKMNYQAQSASHKDEWAAEDREPHENAAPYDDHAAMALGLDPGFQNQALLQQVEGQLSRGEVLHFVCRPSAEIAKKQSFVLVCVAILICVIGVGIGAAMLANPKSSSSVLFIPGFALLVGAMLGIVIPQGKKKQAERGWYAVTDRRAIVFTAPLFGNGGMLQSYTPDELRKMWIKNSFWVKGGGDLIFKSVTTVHAATHTNHGTYRDQNNRKLAKTTTSTQHFGFLGIDNVKDVEQLIHEVLLVHQDD